MLSNDDLLRNSAVKRLKEIVNNLAPDIGVISFKSEIIDEKSKLLLGKYRFGKPRIWSQKEFLLHNVRFLQINASSVAIRKSTFIDIGKFPDEYSVLHDLVFYQRVVSKWDILERKEVLGRYRIYHNKPNSEARSKFAKDDFHLYEQTELQKHINRFPDLKMHYFSNFIDGRIQMKFLILVRKVLRNSLLSLMTLCRRMEGLLGKSGFPRITNRVAR